MDTLKLGYAVGVDLEAISRFRKLSASRNKNFLNRIYTARELKYCFAHRNFAAYLAGRFVAKEAVFKALSALGVKSIHLKQIEIHNDKNGSPLVSIVGKKHQPVQISLSISHCEDKAMAMAVAIRV